MAGRMPPLVLLGALLGSFAQAPAPAVGFVLSATGTWELDGRAVKQGEGVPRGARLTLKNGTRFGAGDAYAIDVVLLNNTLVSLHCASAESCRPGLSVPGSLTTATSLGTRLAAVCELIFERPERFVGLLSRDVARDEATSFVDGVARLDAGRLALAPFFDTLPAGPYHLRFDRVSTGAAASPATIDVRWDRSADSATPQATIVPGLYRVGLSRPTDPTFTEREAWVLVAAGDRFGPAKAAFDDAVAATRTWGQRIPQRDVAIFRHAYLAQLAQQPQ
jgi:hypothetical protein